MKEFDLDKALCGAKLVTRDGRKVTDFEAIKNRTLEDMYPYIAKVNNKNQMYTKDGTFLYTRTHKYDLFLAENNNLVKEIQFTKIDLIKYIEYFLAIEKINNVQLDTKHKHLSLNKLLIVFTTYLNLLDGISRDKQLEYAKSRKTKYTFNFDKDFNNFNIVSSYSRAYAIYYIFTLAITTEKFFNLIGKKNIVFSLTGLGNYNTKKLTKLLTKLKCNEI